MNANFVQGNPIAALQLVKTHPNSWMIKTPIPAQDSSYKAVMVYAEIYVIGATKSYAYNPATDKWTEKAPMPTRRSDFAIAASWSKIYVIGGNNGSNLQREFQGSSYAVNEMYDPMTNTWTTKAPMPTNRSQMNAETVNGKIYVMGGRSGGPSSTTNVTEIYDPATDSWTEGVPLLYPITDYASTTLDGRIYVVGGHDEYLNPNPVLPSDMAVTFTQIYDPATNDWSQGAPIPVYTWQAGAAATLGVITPKRIYVIGGLWDGPTASDNNYAYDPEAGNWTKVASMPERRYLPAVGVLDDIIYVVGGGQGYNTSLTTNQQYIPRGYNLPAPDVSHPSVSILSPSNLSYAAVGNSYVTVPLVFEANVSLSWVGYSLDGGANVTVVNGTSIDLPVNSESLSLYANDTAGNWAVPVTVYFTVAWNGGTPPPEPFPWLPIAAVSVGVAVLVAVAIVVYLKKRKR